MLTYEQQRLAILKKNESEMQALWKRLATYIQGLLQRNTGTDGKLPPGRSDGVRRAAARELTRLMVGVPAQDGHIEPYSVKEGEVRPNSDYMRILWANVDATTRIAVAQHAAMMGQALQAVPEVIKALQNAQGNPFAVQQQIAEYGPDDLYGNPLAAYDPLHDWLDPSNQRLSDNIWDATTEGRRKLDLYLQDAIAQGMGARDMADDLEQFLIPGRNLIRTNKPYGTNASFDAMRLARTEITSAHMRAGAASAQLNPFVDTYDLVLSGSHRDEDICDEIASAGPYAKDDPSGLPPGATHPSCICRVRWNVKSSRADVIAGLREQLQTAKEQARATMGNGHQDRGAQLIDMIGPMQVEVFSKLLLNPRKPQKARTQ